MISDTKLTKFLKKMFVPFTKAMLWAFGLYITISIKNLLEQFSSIPQQKMGFAEDMLSISVIFMVFFFELIVMLINIYIKHKANYIAPRFVLLFGGVLFLVIALLAILVFMLFFSKQTLNSGMILFTILILSSLLKFIGSFIEENESWFIVTETEIFDRRGIFIEREVS